MRTITAPQPIPDHVEQPLIFLAGSIEMGTAENWQAQMIEWLSDVDCTLLNPRRQQSDVSWEESIDNPLFYEQVEWELNALERADYIVMYFSPHTRSPISLLEFGLYARSGKLLVCCSNGFWRKGNVDMVCRRYGITQFDTLHQLIDEMKSRVLTAQTGVRAV